MFESFYYVQRQRPDSFYRITLFFFLGFFFGNGGGGIISPISLNELCPAEQHSLRPTDKKMCRGEEKNILTEESGQRIPEARVRVWGDRVERQGSLPSAGPSRRSPLFLPSYRFPLFELFLFLEFINFGFIGARNRLDPGLPVLDQKSQFGVENGLVGSDPKGSRDPRRLSFLLPRTKGGFASRPKKGGWGFAPPLSSLFFPDGKKVGNWRDPAEPLTNLIKNKEIKDLRPPEPEKFRPPVSQTGRASREIPPLSTKDLPIEVIRGNIWEKLYLKVLSCSFFLNSFKSGFLFGLFVDAFKVGS